MQQAYSISRDKHKNADFKDLKAEMKFLGALLYNESGFTSIINNFNSDVFTNNRLKLIYDKIVEFYFKESAVVRDESILDTLSISKDKRSFYLKLFKKIKAMGKVKHNKGFIFATRHKLEQLYDARIIEIGVRDVLKNLNEAIKGDHKTIIKATEVVKGLSTILDHRSGISLDVNPVQNFDNWLHNYEKYQKNPKDRIGIPTGIEPVDRVITGLRKSEFGLCIADTGVGKSIFLLDTGINCWLKIGDVLYVTIEMPAEQVQDRLWCNVAGIPYEKFRRLTLNDEDKAILRKKVAKLRKHEHKFHIIDMPKGCTVSNISNKVETYMKMHDIKLVLIDYINIISSNAKGSDDVALDWETQVGLAINIKRDIARRLNVPVWSACQVSGDSLAFAKHIKDNIDIGVRFDEDEDTDISGIMNVSYPKARDFKGSKHKISTDRDLMRMSRVVSKKGTEMKKVNCDSFSLKKPPVDKSKFTHKHLRSHKQK